MDGDNRVAFVANQRRGIFLFSFSYCLGDARWSYAMDSFLTQFSSRTRPKLKISAPKINEWLTGHLARMITNHEIQRNPDGSQSILNYKSSVHFILTRIVDSGDRVFAFKATAGSIPFVVFLYPACIWTIQTDNTAAQAFAIVVDQATGEDKAMTITPVELILGEEGAQFWEAVLPAMAERCRDDIHRVGCMFTLDHALRANGFDEICNCGIRKYPMRKHFQKIYHAHRHLTCF